MRLKAHELRANLLQDGPLRQKMYVCHPVVTNKVCVSTVTLKMAYEIVLQAAIHRIPGSFFFGSFRSGKTTLLIRVKSELEKTLPNIAFANTVAVKHDESREREFNIDLLGDMHLEVSSVRKVNELHAMVCNAIHARCEDKKGDCFVLMVDEAQNWGMRDYEMLRDIGNRMDARGIAMIVILVGDGRMQSLRDQVLSKGRHDLYGRFFLQQYHLPGISSQVELADVLTAYDDASAMEYPARSGISYTEFFLPVDFRDGWRLGAEAELAWAAFTSVAARSSREPKNIGMAWVSNAIRHYLFSALSQDEDVKSLSNAELWIECVDNSGYEQSLLGA